MLKNDHINYNGITTKNQNRMCVAGSLQIMTQSVLLKWLFSDRTETLSKCVWLQMARMEMDSNLKTSGGCFKLYSCLNLTSALKGNTHEPAPLEGHCYDILVSLQKTKKGSH